MLQNMFFCGKRKGSRVGEPIDGSFVGFLVGKVAYEYICVYKDIVGVHSITLLYFFRSSGVSKSMLATKNLFIASSIIVFFETPLRLMTSSIDSLLRRFLSSVVVIMVSSYMFGWFTDAKLQKVFHDGKGVISVLENPRA